MVKRRALVEMTDEERAAFLDASPVAVLASIDRRGCPDPVAMWFVMRDGCPSFTTFARSQKVRNLERNPAAAVLVEDGSEYGELRGVVLQGEVELVRDEERIFETMTGIFAKYHPRSVFDDKEAERARVQATKRLLVRFVPSRVKSWDHTKLGGVY